ncbi:MAG: [protein-PII] uridylyltransferase [Planctomycetes bacterium]|nr:[protein-PII] uridylyltransferase [Planctomycetota bacterium]
MQSRPSLPAVVLDARQKLSEGRVKLRAQHDAGSPGIQVCTRLTDLVDGIVSGIFTHSLEELKLGGSVDEIALIPHGGYGRRDLSPYSDLDLMLLHAPSQSQAVVPLARMLSQYLVDAGFTLGFSVRTPAQACSLAWKDAQIFTSLAESRFLIGGHELFMRFFEGFRTGTLRRCFKLIDSVEQARRDEQQKFGETVFLLQPNIKRSRGGLRDIHLLRWVAFARHGISDPEQLKEMGLLSNEDARVIRNGYHFYLRVRNQLHFETGKSQDQLDRNWQLKLAPWYGCKGEEGVLPVEQFMQEYFRHSSEIYYTTTHFVSNSRVRSSMVKWIGKAIGIPIAKDYRLGPRYIWATKEGIKHLQEPSAVLELMDLANRYRRPIEHETWRAIRSAMIGRPQSELGEESIQRFKSLLSRPGRLGKLLRRLHELRVLEQLVPGFRHARCLLQFNEYHKYTVDAHCIRAVECATEFERSEHLVGKIYQKIKRKDLLHLALLLHDLGKGFPEDHSEVGKVIAEETAHRLNLEDSEREMVAFLVHKHLIMTHTAFRYDLSSQDTIVRFAAEVGSSEALQMLFVLTCADLASVGPEVLNQWKLDLITQLYQQTESQFQDEKTDDRFQNALKDRRTQVMALVPPQSDQEWWTENVAALPVSYLLRNPPSHIAHELNHLRELEEQPALAWARYVPQQDATEYSVAVKQGSKTLGVFYRITGVLSGMGLQILEAEIHTQPGDIAWDRFFVQDPDFQGAPPEHRLEEVCRKLEKTFDPKAPATPVFRKVWKPVGKDATAKVNVQPTQVRFDNNTSDGYTVITVFAYDRLGLLYDIAGVLLQMELVLHFAKISTHLDQVVDVFYVTETNGSKVTEQTRLYTIRQRLLKAVC